MDEEAQPDDVPLPAQARKYFTREGRFVRTDAWKKEGKYVDLWSAVHVLSGLAMGFYPRYFGFSMLATFVIVFLLLVMYEMFEVIVKIEEFPTNRVTDVLFGLLGFTPIYFLDQHVGSTTSIFLLCIATTLAVLVSVIGWTYSYKAFTLESTLRAEIATQKTKFKARRERFAANRERRRLRRVERRRY